jgi:hypothetical protein
VSVPKDRRDEYETHSAQVELAMVRKQPDCLGCWVGRREVDSGELEYQWISLWPDTHALDEAIASEAWQREVADRDRHRFIEGKPRVVHYDAIAALRDEV